MSFVSKIIGTAERVPLPDAIVRAAIQRLCSRTATRLSDGSAESDASFAGEMDAALALVLPRHRGPARLRRGSEWGVSHYRMKAG